MNISNIVFDFFHRQEVFCCVACDTYMNEKITEKIDYSHFFTFITKSKTFIVCDHYTQAIRKELINDNVSYSAFKFKNVRLRVIKKKIRKEKKFIQSWISHTPVFRES